MADSPFHPFDSIYALEMDLMILSETEWEPMEIFYTMQEDL